MNISAKFQLYPPHGFWGDDFWIFSLKFSILVANQSNSEPGLDKDNMFDRGLLKEHFYKTLVKIYAVR